MRRSHMFGSAIGIVVGCALTWLIAAGPAPATKPKQWEYTTVAQQYGMEHFEDAPNGLNALGKDGWEVVAATSPPEKDGNYWFCLKREKHEE